MSISLNRRRGLYSFVALLAAVPPAYAAWGKPPRFPLVRILPNLEQAVRERPNDAAAHFVLGRVHGYAFATSSTRVSAIPTEESWSDEMTEESGPPLSITSLSPPVGQRRRSDEPLAPETTRAASLDSALHHLRRSVELEPTKPEHHLGLAYVLEVGAEHCHLLDSVEALGLDDAVADPKLGYLLGRLQSGQPAVRHAAWTELADQGDESVRLLNAARYDDDPVLRAAVRALLTNRWRAHAETSYLRAHELAVAVEPVGADLPTRKFQPGGLRQQFISYEAGEAWLRLVERRPTTDEAELSRRARMAEFLAHVESAPQSGRVTPIIFSLTTEHPVADIDALLAPECAVNFDLDGDTLVERRPWLAPDTALLCWDPDDHGQVSSGRQLFGNATWWLLFEDGYRALDALDDDRDGWLDGDELSGLSVWRDADQDAVSDPGEVVDIRRAGVEALATRATSQVGVHLAAASGMRLASGCTLPTWDWVAPLIEKPSTTSVPTRAHLDGRVDCVRDFIH